MGIICSQEEVKLNSTHSKQPQDTLHTEHQDTLPDFQQLYIRKKKSLQQISTLQNAPTEGTKYSN